MLRGRVIAKMAEQLERGEEELSAAIRESPEASVMDLGLTSAMGIALKGWVFHELEAELTTFQLLKQPLDDVIMAIEGARRQEVGLQLPVPT